LAEGAGATPAFLVKQNYSSVHTLFVFYSLNFEIIKKNQISLLFGEEFE
jgi:hypothetical protein